MLVKSDLTSKDTSLWSSGIFNEIVMQNIEEQVLATYSETLPHWLRYDDDTITAVHENKIDEFHEHLNEQNTNIQFTKEIEENGKIPFLDCLVTPELIEGNGYEGRQTSKVLNNRRSYSLKVPIT